MIPCPKCEADNQIGAIFCRSCGEKLDLDDINPEMVLNAAKKAREDKVNWFAWTKNAIILLILAYIVFFVWCLFRTPADIETYEFDKVCLRKANLKLNDFFKGARISLSEDEVNALAVKYFGLSEDDIEEQLDKQAEKNTSVMIAHSLVVSLEDDDRVRITMYQKRSSGGYQKYYSTIAGTLKVGKNGLTLKPDTYAMGRNSFGSLSFLRNKIVERFVEQYNNAFNKDLEKLIKAVRSVKVVEDKIYLTGKPSAPAPVVKPKNNHGRRRRR